MNTARIGLNDVGQTQGQGQGCQESLTARQGVGRTGIARIIVIDFDIQANLLDPLVVPGLGALQAVTLAAHALEAPVGGGQDLIEEGPEDVAFKVDARLLAGNEFIDGADGLISFGQVLAFLLQSGQGFLFLLPALVPCRQAALGFDQGLAGLFSAVQGRPGGGHVGPFLCADGGLFLGQLALDLLDLLVIVTDGFFQSRYLRHGGLHGPAGLDAFKAGGQDAVPQGLDALAEAVPQHFDLMLPVLRFLLLLGRLPFAGDDGVAAVLQVLFIGPDSAVQGIQSLLQRQRVAIGCRQVRFQACLRLSGFSRSGPRLFHGRPGRFFVLFPAGQSGLAGGDGLFQLFTVPDLLLQAFHSHLSLSGLGLPVRQGPVLGILSAQGLVLGLQGLAAGFIGFGCHFPLLALAFTGFGPFLMLFDVVPFRQGFRAHSRQGMGFRAADRAGLALFQFRRQDSCLGLQEQGPDAFIGNAFVPGFGRRFF